MNSIILLVIQILTGAAGGNIAGLLRKFSLGSTGNTIVGALGSLIFSNFIPLWNFNDHALINVLLNGLVSGAIVTFIIGLLRNLLRNTR